MVKSNYKIELSDCRLMYNYERHTIEFVSDGGKVHLAVPVESVRLALESYDSVEGKG